MAQSKNPPAELFYNTRPVFFTYNSVDQIHPRDLDRYFEWNKLPKIALNWINQTEATINLPIANITQFKLTNWFSFGDVYFNVIKYKMIATTSGNEKMYQYFLKMNIHNTFLPSLFNHLAFDNNVKSYTTIVKRTSYYSGIAGQDTALKKIDPALDFKNKNYCLVSSCVDYNSVGGLLITKKWDGVASQSWPTLLENWRNRRYLYFTYEQYDDNYGGINRVRVRRYKSIKWYVWKNPATKTYILIPSIVDREAKLETYNTPTNYIINQVVNPSSGKWKEVKNDEQKVVCSNSDDDIETWLLNNTTDNTAFANQANFVGAFFGPAITGGQWVYYQPLRRNDKTFICCMTDNNLDIFNGDGSNNWWTPANKLNHGPSKLFTSLPLTVTNNTIITNKLVSRDLVNNDVNAAWSWWILSNLSVGEMAYKIIEYTDINNRMFKTIPLTNIQVGNNITGTNKYYPTPYGTFTFNYPQTNTIITDAYQQYLNSVRNSQDTSMAIAKQNMITNTAQHVANGVIGAGKAAATMANPLNWLNPAKMAGGALDAAQAVSDTAFGITREILAYENKQKEIDAANMDKQNSIGATMYASTVNDAIQNLMYGRGVGDNEYFIFDENQSDKTKCNLPLMYWTSYLGKLPTSLIELTQYSSYLFWNGIYLDERYPIMRLAGIFLPEINDTANAGFVYVDMEMPTMILDEFFGNLNMDYKMAIQTIFNNGLRLYFGGATPMQLTKSAYSPFIAGA